MIASSWMDPVLGVDLHWEMVPTPAPVPMPFPHPFIGLVLDVGGLIGSVVMGGVMSAVTGAPFQGPVIHWFLPATNTGTESRHVPGHFIIPPGTIWAPVPRTPKPKIRPGEAVVPAPPIKPENDAVAIFGSKTVTIGGSNAVRLGDIQLSCSEPVRLPSSVVLAIPKGAPILIGGPPSLDLMAAVLASLRTRFISDSLHALVSRLAPGRIRNLLNRTVCFFTGHPVDVASGKVMTSGVDAELPGPLPLEIERVYSSAFGDRDGPLGHGWSLSLDQGIWIERGKVVLLEADGREIEFDTFDLPERRMRPGDRVWQPIERLELECLDGGRWRVKAVDGLVREFGPVPGRQDGRAMILRTRSRCGHHDVAFEYDRRGLLEWVRDACGRLIWLERNEVGRVAALKLPVPSGQGWYVHRRYGYDARGDLIQVTDALGQAWRFEYATHLLVRETDRTGLSFHFEYDGLGQDAWCTRTWGDGGIYDHRLAYDKANKITFVTNSRGHTTQYRMNVAGLVVKVVDPLGGETRHEYDPTTLQKTAEIDALGAARRWEYDARGNRVRSLGPDGAAIAVAYDARDRPVRAVDPCGGTWEWEYDGTGALLRERDARGGTTEYRRREGLVREIVEPGGGRIAIEYDAGKNPVAFRDPDGGETRFWYDALGRTVRRRAPNGGEERLRYDAGGRVVERREADGNVQRLAYDPEGNLTAFRDALREVTYGHQGFHRLAWKEEGGDRIRLHHDSEGALIAVENEAGAQTRFRLDPRGEMVEEVGFDGAVRRYERDALGRVVVETRPSGLRTEVRWDAAGRIVGRRHSDGTAEEYGYRPDGALLWASNESGRVELERDPLGKIVAEVQGGHRVSSRYDASGRRIGVESSLQAYLSALRSPGGKVEELVLSADGSWAIGFDRDAMGLELERRLPGGVVAAWDRDPASRPTAHRTTAAGQTTSTAYQWDVGGQLRALSDGARGSTRYVHDGRGRLAGAIGPDGRALHRAPDAVGNVYRRPDRGDRQYGAGGALEAAGGTQYRYDPDGNLVEKRCADGSAWRYAWNGAGRLKEVVRPDGTRVELSYDALGRRVRKRTADDETQFVWDGDVVLHELSARSGVTTWYFEPDSFAPVAKAQGGRRYSVVTDHLGTPSELYDELGQIAWRMQLDAFGVGRPDVASTSCPWRWPGQYEDVETGLHYNRFRYYDPDAGAYVSPDPIGLEGGTAPYAYPSDPNAGVDPLGLTPAVPDFATLLDMAKNSLDFSTARDGAVFWSGPRMLDAQAWAEATGRTTLEQTPGGRYLDSLQLFGPSSPLTPAQAAQVWDAASVRFAQGASGEVSVFSTGATRMGAWGERTWWRIERPALLANPNVTRIVRRKKDGTPCR